MTVHGQLNRRRGPARDHRCSRCDAQAEHWSYDGLDPDQITEARKGYGKNGHRVMMVSYSLDLRRYIPPCRPCHSRLDYRLSARAMIHRLAQLDLTEGDRAALRAILDQP